MSSQTINWDSNKSIKEATMETSKRHIQENGCKIEKTKNTHSFEGLNGTPIVIWDKKVPDTQLEKLKKAIEQKYNIHLDSYWDLHKWSVEKFENFWEEVWNFLEVISSSPYEQVYKKTGEGLLDGEWFTGATFNFAENLLRIRDDSIALICADERGYEEYVTFAEMFEEVKLYAAAFKENGLQKGDRVACYMSNRKEAIFTFLAATSIGAIFGGPQPYFGARPATNIIQMMEPKFLISIDHHVDSEVDYYNIDNLEYISNNTPSLEKIIIVATRPETKSRDISDIRNSCLLEDFLKSGTTPDGTVPDLYFEQLPFSHPIVINFTSGTTGLPKGPVHSAGTLISHLTSVEFYWNLKSGDVILSCYPVGWTLWDTFVVALARGVTLLLYSGSLYRDIDGCTVWDVCSYYKVSYTFLATGIVDILEKKNIVPRPGTNLESLKFVTMGGSPVKLQNYLFMHNKVKKDLFICSQYGASETFGTFSGFDLNLPIYAGEIQAPGLGMGIHCFDEEGNSILNKRGELVLTTPTPSLPIYLWKDHDGSIMKENYLAKYPGLWCQNDKIWINPVTKGLVVVGRSDDTIMQCGDRFGAGDIYFAIHDMEEVHDSVCVAQTREDGDCRAVLFIKMQNGYSFTAEFRKKVQEKISDELWTDCVPQAIVETKGIPYNLNNKKMESIVRKIVNTNKIPEANNIKDPGCLKYFCDVPEIVNFLKI